MQFCGVQLHSNEVGGLVTGKIVDEFGIKGRFRVDKADESGAGCPLSVFFLLVVIGANTIGLTH